MVERGKRDKGKGKRDKGKGKRTGEKARLGVNIRRRET
jgi:hypothetical protein